MKTIAVGLSSLLAMLAIAPGVAHAIDSGFVPPIGFYVNEQFNAFDARSWESVGGSWSSSAATYDSTGASNTAISTVFEYFIDPVGEPRPTPRPEFTLRTRILNRGAMPTQLAGVVFNYLDSANYDEAVCSPTGTLLVRRVTGGSMATVLTTSYAGGAQNIWFELELVVTRDTLTITINGITRVNRSQFVNAGGRVGLVTHNTPAKFDYLRVGSPFNEQPFREDFSSGELPFPTSTLTWNVSGGTLNNPATESTSRASIGAGLFFAPETTVQYTLWTRMFNPYGASGNVVGMFFNDDGVGFPGAHGELLFSPTGQARIDLFYDGSKHTIATAPYRGGPKQWFDVRLDNHRGAVSVWVDGALVFGDVSTFPVDDGFVGLLTHWSPGRFDDVWWDNNPHPTLVAKFAEPLDEQTWKTTGTWDTSGGTLNSTAVDASDLALSTCACWSTDAVIRARLLNQFGASGNLVGVVYNYADAVVAPDKPDYYEVVFSSTGIAQLNKVLNGVRTHVARGTHTVPKNTWFNVVILRRGTTTTVKLNGSTIFNNVQQGELGAGKVGLVTHWSKGRFDNVIVRDDPIR